MTLEHITAIVRKIADAIVADGQLDECNITFREITLIRESLINTLVGMYHHRISYPGFNPPSETRAHEDDRTKAEPKPEREPDAEPEAVGVGSHRSNVRTHKRH
jgi:hypothetical protein